MKYELKPQINMVLFLRAVECCDGEVCFESGEGDILNLKSQLSKYLFLTVTPDAEYLMRGKITCTPEDANILSGFVVL